MLETSIVAFVTFFTTISPIEVAAMFAVLTSKATPAQRKSLALRGTLIATGLLLAFALLGEALLGRLGISLSALRTAGGILLLLMGIDMVFARPSGGTSTTQGETEEAKAKQDIAVFPLATPLIAGPGAMGAAILMMANVENDLVLQGTVLFTLLVMMLLTFLALLSAGQISRLLGVTGLQVISRVLGVLLSALAVQFIFDGIMQSGLVGS